MTDKQHEDMATIMKSCRIFSEQMHRCMEHSGLLEQGYQLTIWVGEFNYYMNEECEIQLENNKTLKIGDDEWYKGRMHQTKYTETGWVNSCERYSKEEPIPSEVCTEERKPSDDRKGEGTDGTKPYPPDGFWVSSHYCPCDVDGGV